MGMPGPIEIGVILLLLFLLFGAKRIPKMMRGWGEAVAEMRQIGDEAMQDMEDAGYLEDRRGERKT